MERQLLFWKEQTLPLSVQIRRKLSPFALLLAGFLAGCGSSNSSVAPAVNALTNPDRILFASGRTATAAWSFFAMNPDGSGVVPMPTLDAVEGSDARYVVGLAVNQSGALVTLTVLGATGAVHNLVRLSDGAVLYGASALRGRNFAANSGGTQIAFAGSPADSDPYAIYLLNPDGTNQTLAAAVPAGSFVSEIAFAPDDKTLYYVVVSSGPGIPIDPGATLAKGALTKLSPGAVPVVVANVDAQIQSVHTSQDGTQLAFISYAQAADLSSVTFTPYTLKADGTGIAKGAVTTLAEPLAPGVVSPLNVGIASRADGFHVLYVSPVAGIEQLFDMRPNGSGLQQITSNAGGSAVPGTRAAAAGPMKMLGGR